MIPDCSRPVGRLFYIPTACVGKGGYGIVGHLNWRRIMDTGAVILVIYVIVVIGLVAKFLMGW